MLPTTRFSNRVHDYVKYRPDYPEAAIEFLTASLGLTDASVVADLGSGTGISSKPFLLRGMTVFGIEPNTEMREAGEEFLSDYSAFISNHGTAEATGLPDHSVDLVVAAQAFHWFNIEAVKFEVRRILKKTGSASLLWNERLTDTSPFLRDYEALLQTFGTDYSKVDHRNVTPEILHRFFEDEYDSAEFPNVQRVDYDGLEGRLRSSSYVPSPGDAGYQPMIDELGRLFDKYAKDGTVDIDYSTKVYLGKV